MTELTKAYGRGYNAGKKRQTWYLDRIIAIARSYRLRLRSTELERFGNANWMSRECKNCARWKCGGLNYKWGFCGMRFATEVGEPAMWTDLDGGEIITHEDFGCVSWLHPEHPLRAPFSALTSTKSGD